MTSSLATSSGVDSSLATSRWAATRALSSARVGSKVEDILLASKALLNFVAQAVLRLLLSL